MLGYKTDALAFLLYKMPADQKYTKFEIIKKNGGIRDIHAPVERIKTLQRHLANILYACRTEIERENPQRKPLSHGFRKSLSIVTNAQCHKNRRYVLNLDIQDFFPSFNFGRVRGFFIKNHDFALEEKIATIIAQIACHENVLPQGSPCSPVIADMLAHLLDIPLVQLSKRHGITYSRYADDLTFSTNKRDFPTALAKQEKGEGPNWVLSSKLAKIINKSGFTINPRKTHMQYRTGRQLVTGLTVNKKVNIRSNYYRLARAMCNSLFQTGSYHRPTPIIPTEVKLGAVPPEVEKAPTLDKLHGILNHIHYVKDLVDIRDYSDKKKNALEKKTNPTSFSKLYKKFLFYRKFIVPKQPLIICEGKTDNIYLKYAIKYLDRFHPFLGIVSNGVLTLSVSFFNYSRKSHQILGLNGGTGDLKYLILKYGETVRNFKHKPQPHPVIILIDNDDGAKQIFSVIKDNYNLKINLNSKESFFHITENLYLIKTPGRKSCIENFFDASVTGTELRGMKFNPDKKHEARGEYGKAVFADQVVRANAAKIDFIKFTSILERIKAVIDDYTPTD